MPGKKKKTESTVAERMVSAREALGLSTAQLARRLGVQTRTLSAWETGASEPRSNRLVNLAGVREVETEMQAVHPDARIDVKQHFFVPPLQPEPQGEAEMLVRALTGDNAGHVVSYGTEAGQFQAAGYSAVICGPGDIAQAHQPNEYITVAQFNAGIAFMERLVQRLATEG